MSFLLVLSFIFFMYSVYSGKATHSRAAVKLAKKNFRIGELGYIICISDKLFLGFALVELR